MYKGGFDNYLRAERQYSEHTRDAYHRDLDSLDRFLQEAQNCSVFDAEDVKTLNHRHLRSWMHVLMDSGLGRRTVARKLSAAKTYFAWLQRTEKIATNPAGMIKVPKFEKPLPAFLKESETEALFEEIDFGEGWEGARDRCMMEMLYGCGLRRSELISLKTVDVDLADRTLLILGKGGKERRIPMGVNLLASVKDYLGELDRAGQGGAQTFFIRKGGKMLYPKLIYRIVRGYLSQVTSLSKRSPHVLRHTFATHMLDRGADLNAIKDFLGHSSLASTQVYTHNTISKLKSVHQQAHPRAEEK